MIQDKKLTINKPFLQTVNAIKKFSLNLNVKRFTTDANGAILADAAIPASEKKPFPFHLFGNFDMQGGYNIADSAMSEVHSTKLFSMYIAGIGTQLFFFNPLATINNEIKKGDVVFIYVDDINAPNFFTFIIVTSIVGAYASLVSQSNISQIDANGFWGVFKIFDVKYSWFDNAQLHDPVYIITSRFDSGFKYDVIDPATYYDSATKKNILVANIPLNIVLNQYIGLSAFLAYENPLLNLHFSIYV